MYSIHEGIRGIALDPNDNSEALMPITGTLFAVGVDFHAGKIQCVLTVLDLEFKTVYMHLYTPETN